MWLAPVIFLYIPFQIIILYCIFFETDGIEGEWGTPKYIYDNTDCNMFGCILITLLGIVLIPVYYIIYFIYFICHIGRK